jgi:hypothetical protein
MADYYKVRDMINERDSLMSRIESRRKAMREMQSMNEKEFNRLLDLDEELAGVGIFTDEYIKLQAALREKELAKDD